LAFSVAAIRFALPGLGAKAVRPWLPFHPRARFRGTAWLGALGSSGPGIAAKSGQGLQPSASAALGALAFLLRRFGLAASALDRSRCVSRRAVRPGVATVALGSRSRFALPHPASRLPVARPCGWLTLGVEAFRFHLQGFDFKGFGIAAWALVVSALPPPHRCLGGR